MLVFLVLPAVREADTLLPLFWT